MLERAGTPRAHLWCAGARLWGKRSEPEAPRHHASYGSTLESGCDLSKCTLDDPRQADPMYLHEPVQYPFPFCVGGVRSPG